MYNYSSAKRSVNNGIRGIYNALYPLMSILNTYVGSAQNSSQESRKQKAQKMSNPGGTSVASVNTSVSSLEAKIQSMSDDPRTNNANNFRNGANGAIDSINPNTDSGSGSSANQIEQVLNHYGGAVLYQNGKSYASNSRDAALAGKNKSLYQGWQNSMLGRLVAEYLNSKGLRHSNVDGYVSMDLKKVQNKSSQKQGQPIAAIIEMGDGKRYLAVDNQHGHKLNDTALAYVLGHEYIHDRGIGTEESVRAIYAKSLWHAAKRAAGTYTGKLAEHLKKYADYASQTGREIMPSPA